MTNEQERPEDEQFEQELAELIAEFGAENVSVMGKHGIKKLTLIWEEKEYLADEEEFEYLGRSNNEKG